MIIVDASVWVSRFIQQDAFHASSKRWLMAQLSQGERLISPNILLAELSGAVARRSGLAQAGERAALGILNLPGVRMVSINRWLALESARLAAQLGLRGADALYLAVATRLKAPLFTWDSEMLDKGGRLVTVRQPAEDS
jgi:predicted nucleic acid-binding protein